MISLLRGSIAEKNLENIIVDVNGVGYAVTVPLSTYHRLPEIGKETQLKIFTQMKDSSIELFGFLTEDEKKAFAMLIGVSGIGPKGATNILSNISPGELASSIRSGNLRTKDIPGIGKKLASRLITELKDKVSEIEISEEEKEPAILEDVISALMNLGYKKGEINEHILQIEEAARQENDIESALRESLKVMKRV